jgi:hypothetical protein
VRRSDIRKHFDEIVGFAGVEKFLDTPVKRYSSGMRMRLAFATAAHIEPPIIVVDEVLAVGDAAFRERCLGKMSEIGRHGRTVLYVSHDLGSITRICPRAIWLDHGQIRADGPASEVVSSYLGGGTAKPMAAEFVEANDRPGCLLAAAVRDTYGHVLTRLQRDQPFVVDLHFRTREPTLGLDVAIWLVNDTGLRVIDDAWADAEHDQGLGRDPGMYQLEVAIPPVLAPGRYTLGVWIGTEHEELVADRDLFTLEVAPRPDDTTEMVERRRLVQPPVQWSMRTRP